MVDWRFSANPKVEIPVQVFKGGRYFVLET
jgi:hypothetical protein